MRLIETVAFINPSAKELSMIASNMGRVPVSPKQKQMTDDCGAQGPMSQQDAGGSHGREMHPQEFVRLVGCHESNAGKQEAARRLH
jgi:hypothetical protein